LAREIFEVYYGSSGQILIVAHGQGMRIQSYEDQLLNLAADLAQRLLPAFDTPTGSLPFLVL
jgi:mannosidase alpha-like ER degradation enhancer 2